MKRILYILCFAILGVLVSMIAHALIELSALAYIMRSKTPPLLTWPQWEGVHDIASLVLVLLGTIGGFFCGRFFWPRLYDPDGRRRPWKSKNP
jgi:hypothetical protein